MTKVFHEWRMTLRSIVVENLPAIIFLSAMVAFASQISCSQTVETLDEATRYEFYDDRVYDKQTNLSWMRCSVGQKRKAPDRCIGTPRGFTFYEAQRLPRKGYAWRVPSPFEFSTLFRGQVKTQSPSRLNEFPKINIQAFPDMDLSRLLYWTNETTSDTNAWYADFGTGTVEFVYGDYGFLHQKFPVRLMHMGNFGDGG